ncbi:uncharacterized protein DDB_G0287625-like [Centruroides vittatus]|uniref:uncharacterized protein DDB_G0287625-like n=1 Tax=Centruroides vittatus TaxID=120091 RepID=UPI00350ECCDB
MTIAFLLHDLTVKLKYQSPGSGFSNNLGNVNRTSPRQLTSRNVNPSSYNTQGLAPQKDGYSNYSPSIPSQLSLQKASVSEENSQRKKGKALTPCELLRDQISLNLPLATFRFANENQQTGGYTGDASSGERNPSSGFNDNPGRRGRNTSGRDGNIGVSRQTNYSPINSFPSGRSGRPQSQTYVQLPHKNSNVPVLVGYQYNRSPANLPSQTQRNKQNFNTVPPNLNRFSFDNSQQNIGARFSNAGNVAKSSNPAQNSGQSIVSDNIPQNQNKQASVVQNNYPNSDNEQRSNYSPQSSSSISQSGGNSQDFRSGNRNKNVKVPRIYYNNDHSGRTGSNTGLSINNSGRSQSSYTYYRPTSTPNHPTEPVEKATFGTAYITIAPLPLDVDGDEIPGRAGVDYPTYHAIPTTSFTCNQVPFNGYYADMEASCQVVHFCQSGGVQNSFLCPNGTIFSQKKFSCQWWYKTNCTESPFYFSLNSDLYKIPSKKLN